MILTTYDFDGSAQDCSNYSVLAMELLQSCTKPLIYSLNLGRYGSNSGVIFRHIFVMDIFSISCEVTYFSEDEGQRTSSSLACLVMRA